MTDPARIARQERINEIYRSVWNPSAQAGEELPLTPEDHIKIVSFLVQPIGQPWRSCGGNRH